MKYSIAICISVEIISLSLCTFSHSYSFYNAQLLIINDTINMYVCSRIANVVLF